MLDIFIVPRREIIIPRYEIIISRYGTMNSYGYNKRICGTKGLFMLDRHLFVCTRDAIHGV